MLKLSLIIQYYYNDVAGVPSSNLAMGSFRGDPTITLAARRNSSGGVADAM